jgi:hypothetical protein
MLVYRDAARTLTRDELQRELTARIARCESNPAALPRSDREAWLALLLTCAEVETALEDRVDSSPVARARVRSFTDSCAEAWWTGVSADTSRWAGELAALALPERLVLKRAEGYAYYALDPEKYAHAVAARAVPGCPVLVIGIRSIGTSLSAVAVASLRARGVQAERISVRPSGHAWERHYSLADPELATLRAREGAECFVVDEGPGLSGSTFLAVGEGLERAGVPLDRITFFTSHQVDAAQLVARDAAQRWKRFRAHVVPDTSPFEGALDLGGGRWREHAYASSAEWPACWPNAERRKFRLPGSPDMIQFVGLGPYGEAPLARAEELARGGFGPAVTKAGSGYLRQRWCDGELLRRPLGPLTHRLVPRLIEYLAFRNEAFPAPEAQPRALEQMARVNVAEALGVELPSSFSLEVERPVYADGRLAPREWVPMQNATLIKLDAIDHGDDHFFPGPCDSAWDLAGAIVELELSDADAGALLAAYGRRTGDFAAARLPAYRVAYSACRLGYFDMAAASSEPLERQRLTRERDSYSAHLCRWLDAFPVSGPVRRLHNTRHESGEPRKA